CCSWLPLPWTSTFSSVLSTRPESERLDDPIIAIPRSYRYWLMPRVPQIIFTGHLGSACRNARLPLISFSIERRRAMARRTGLPECRGLDPRAQRDRNAASVENRTARKWQSQRRRSHQNRQLLG